MSTVITEVTTIGGAASTSVGLAALSRELMAATVAQTAMGKQTWQITKIKENQNLMVEPFFNERVCYNMPYSCHVNPCFQHPTDEQKFQKLVDLIYGDSDKSLLLS